MLEKLSARDVMQAPKQLLLDTLKGELQPLQLLSCILQSRHSSQAMPTIAIPSACNIRRLSLTVQHYSTCSANVLEANAIASACSCSI